MDKILKNKSSKSIPNKNYKFAKKSEEKDKNPKDKYIKFRGKEIKVKYDEFMLVKGLDMQKLQASKDSMVQMMKRKVEFHKNQNEVYNMNILNKISIDRENELRNAIISLQKEILKKKQRSREELESLYKSVLTEVKNIYERTSNEIDQRKSDLMDRIMLSIANCDYKQAQLLESKIKEQEEFFRHLHMFTFEMQQIRDNFDDSLKKIKFLTESNYELKKNILQEKLKFQHITSLMKEFKIRANYMANKINNYRATTHILENLNTNNKTNKNKKNIYININDNNRIATAKNRPYSTIFKQNKLTSTSLGTNYTQNNTHFNLEHLKNSVEGNYYLYTNTEKEEEKGKEFKLSLMNNDIIDMTEGNIQFIKRKRDYEKNIINVLKKDIEIWNNKILNIINKYQSTIPDNQIYYSLTEIVETLRQDKNNKFFGQYFNNNVLIKKNMMVLPVQNKQFRKIFLDLLFRNKEIFEAIRNGQKNDVDKYFNKNLFGAEKVKSK